MHSFKQLGIHNILIDTLKSLGISTPTPIQEEAIPVILNHKDIIAQAQTGTGKTLAFVVPIVQKINVKGPFVQALIVTPTRELAIQITNEIKKLISRINGVHVLSIYGGQDVERQLRQLNATNQIVVATPGRLLDHMRRQSIDLTGVNMFVLDEADQMLQMGFLSDVDQIVDQLPVQKQAMLFSATITNDVRTLSNKFMVNPEIISIKKEKVILDNIKQMVYETTDRMKQDVLGHLINQFRPYLAIIFCRTKRRAKVLNEALQSKGYLSDELHGDLSQSKREHVLESFRNGKIQLLVATDVAARGLDIEGITHVINYDIPHDVESYIHRIGRTGRAGFEGIAITLVASKDTQYLKMIEKGIHLQLKRKYLKTKSKKNNVGKKLEKPRKNYRSPKR